MKHSTSFLETFKESWEGEYKFHADDSDRILYEEIQKLGYHPSDVEESMMDGSWELFEK